MIGGPVREPHVSDVVLRKMPGTRALCAPQLAAFLVVFLAGCAGEVPVPFLNAALPPAPPGPAPQYPTMAPPAVEGSRAPVMTNAEREAVEAQLKKLVEDREGTVKRKIDKSN